MNQVKRRQNVVISHKYTDGSSCVFDKQIILDFTPSDVIVRYIRYIANGNGNQAFIDSVDTSDPSDNVYTYLAPPEPRPSLLHTTLVNDIIGMIYDSPSTISVPTKWSLGRPISGDYRFSLINAVNLTDTERSGTILIHLEFISIYPLPPTDPTPTSLSYLSIEDSGPPDWSTNQKQKKKSKVINV